MKNLFQPGPQDATEVLNLKFFMAEVATYIEGYSYQGFLFPVR